jgi:hypothetical protein
MNTKPTLEDQFIQDFALTIINIHKARDDRAKGICQIYKKTFFTFEGVDKNIINRALLGAQTAYKALNIKITDNKEELLKLHKKLIKLQSQNPPIKAPYVNLMITKLLELITNFNEVT